MNLEYTLSKNILVNHRTFNPSIIIDLKDNKYTNKITLYDRHNFILSYRSCSYDPCSKSRLCIKNDNIIEYDESSKTIRLIFHDNNIFFDTEEDSFEDARFSILNNELHVIYSSVAEGVKQYLTPYSNKTEKISILKGVNLNEWEKNWIIFNKSNSNNTFIIYSLFN